MRNPSKIVGTLCFAHPTLANSGRSPEERGDIRGLTVVAAKLSDIVSLMQPRSPGISTNRPSAIILPL
jgi:hypothetical protein